MARSRRFDATPAGGPPHRRRLRESDRRSPQRPVGRAPV